MNNGIETFGPWRSSVITEYFKEISSRLVVVTGDMGLALSSPEGLAT